MKMINKINYEQFAIDYLEGNLSGDLLVEMNEFLAANSDIKEELDEMKLYYLEADDEIVFEGKETLIQPIAEQKRFFIRPLFLMVGIVTIFILTLGLYLFPSNNQGTNITKTTLENTNENSLVIDNNNKTEEPIISIDNQKDIANNNTKSITTTAVIDKQENITIQKNNNSKVINSTKDKVIATNKNESNPQFIEDTKAVIIKKQPSIQPQTPIKTNPMIKIIESVLPQKNQESEPIAQEDKPDTNNQLNSESDYNNIIPIRTNIDLEPLQFASLDMNSNNITLENTLTVVEKPLEESRLRKMGLLPENKINFKSMKEALTPEFFASKD